MWRAGVVALVACLTVAGSARAATGPNPIQVENQKPGTTSWELSGKPSTNIEGYASDISLLPGQAVRMHVSTAGSARYRIEIYRLGWYGGDGARLVACIPVASGGSCVHDKPGVQQPVPAPDPTTGKLDAGWPITDRILVGSAWTTGYYLAKLVLTSGTYAGQASYIPFIVRAPAGSQAPILVQASVNTWEAYNNWGGKSLYTFNSTDKVAATHVSFNRPFSNVPSNSTPLTWEYQAVRFLEREGYDVNYQTDVDTDEHAGSLLGYRLLIVNGHDEYWSRVMRDAFDAARDHGVNLAFVGADIGSWQLRYQDGDRTLVEYRSASADPDPDPSQKTDTFQNLGRPECELLGVNYQGGLVNNGQTPGDYTVTSVAAANPWFVGTGLTPGVTLTGEVGYEWDAIQAGCNVPPLQDLFHWDGPAGTNANAADGVEYVATSGARVFSDGVMNMVWRLDDWGNPGLADTRVQDLFRNIFDDLGAAPAVAPPA